MTAEKPILKPLLGPIAFKEVNNENALREAVISVPAANIDETSAEYMITLAVPGFEREHFEIQLKDQLIHISAQKKESAFSCIADRHEYDFSGWEREFFLPEDADALMTTANYQNGELCIHIPRSAYTVRQEESIKIYVY